MPKQTLPTDASQLDPKVVKVMSVLKKIESGGDYNAVGDLDRGVSRGAYQFNKNNFQNWAKEYGLDPNDFSPANQNKLMYSRIKKQKDQGLEVEEIAALHNGAKKGADGRYTYINPEYGEKFRNALGATKVAQASTQTGGTYAPPPEPKPFEAAAPQENQQEKGIVRKGLEFLFPILEDKERTGLQTAADLGLSALTLVPGLGAAGLGAKAGILGAKTAVKGLVPAIKGANALKGAAAGYGVDVLSNVSEGETGKGTLMPGLGTVLGGAGGALLGRAKGTTAGKNIIDEQALNEALDIVAAPARKANIKAALKQGLGGRAGLVGSKVAVGADTKTKNAAEAIKDMVVSGEIKAGHTVEQNANAVRSKIETLATDLETKLTGMEIQPLITRQELQKLIKNTEKKFKEDEILVGDAGESAKRIFNKFIKYLPKGKDITAIDILKARKALDAEVRNSGRGRLFDPKIETAISTALREIRQGANDLLASKAPDVAVKESLQQQSRLYDALEAIAENGWRDVGKGKIQRYIQRHPNQKALIQYGVGGGVGAGVLNYFDGQ